MGMRVRMGERNVLGDMNVTPMIDVLLVLLVIFMVVQQGLQRAIPAQVPPPGAATMAPEAGAIVLQVEAGGVYRLNQEPVPAHRLAARLEEVFAGRPRSVLFVQGAESARYGEVVQALDVSRRAGVQVLGLVPRSDGG
jgi:biopolymer transport protein TolR